MDPNLGIIEMTLTKFNELYTGVALVINDTVPANVTRLTDGEMRNIKAMSHWVKVQTGSYWVPGYWYYTYKWINTSYWVPYLYWKWVPGYYLWGWIPIPGHYEPRIGWYYIRCGFWLPIAHYVQGYWCPTYEYVEVPDPGDKLNLDKAGHVTVAGSTLIGYGLLMIAAGIGEPVTGGFDTPVTVFATIGAIGAVWDLSNAMEDPTWIKG